MKKTGPKKIQLSRETLIQLDSEALGHPHGGVVTYSPPCEVSEVCNGTGRCSNTACGNC